MSINELQGKLEAVVDNYARELEFTINISGNTLNKAEQVEMYKAAFYALNEFKTEIIKYLRSQQ